MKDGKGEEALETVDALRRLDVSLAGNAKVDLVAAWAYYRQDPERAMELADAAVGKATRSRSKHLRARALFSKAYMLDERARYEEALEALDAATVDFEITGDRNGLRDSFVMTATVLSRLGDFQQAKNHLERFYAAYRDSGELVNAARLGTNFANVFLFMGRYAEAEPVYREAIYTFERLGAKQEGGMARLNLGVVFHETCRLAAAEESYGEARTTFEEIDDGENLATVLTDIGEIRYLRARLSEAEQLYDAALNIHEKRKNLAGEAYVKFRKGELFAAKGNSDAAESSYQSALKIQTGHRNKRGMALTRLGLAELALYEDNFGWAKKLAGEAEAALWDLKIRDTAVVAKTVLARALLKKGNVAEAREHADLAESHSERSQAPRVRFAAKIVAALVSAESGDPEKIAAAADSLENVTAKAGAAGLVVDELKARFALGVVEMKTEPAVGRARLEALAAEADGRGLGLIVDRVRAHLRRETR